MIRYTVHNTHRETKTQHGSWQAAFRAGTKEQAAHPADNVEVIETDRDGQRTYDLSGAIIGRD